MSFEYSQYTTLFTKTLEAIQNGYGLVVHEGGTNSSKTWSILQALYVLALNDPGCVITVVGQDIPNLKKGAMRDARQILANEPQLQAEFYPLQKTDRFFESRHGGSLIEFTSYDDKQDAQSGKRDYAFFNEANGITYDIYDAVNVRTGKASIVDFNPTAKFWAHTKILPDTDNRKWYVSNYRHNPYIEPNILQKILSYEPTPENVERGTANEYLWMVYGLGKVGRLEGLVLKDFESTPDWPEDYRWRVFGLDFGFTNHETALVEIRYAHGMLYWKQHIYATGLTNVSPDETRQPSIDGYLDRLEWPNDRKVIADSAEPKSIKTLRDKGWNVVGAKKGPGSVLDSIEILQRYTHRIHVGSQDILTEFNSWQWKTDKDGEPLNKPIDKFDHAINAGMYAITEQVHSGGKLTKTKLLGV